MILKDVAMPTVTAQQFIDALWHLEATGEAEPIAELFSPQADISNPVVKREHEGAEGALAFWSAYRASFEGIRSEFRHILQDPSAAMLEWTSEGTANGGPVHYRGVSVLEFDEHGISAFRTYFDTRRLERQIAAGVQHHESPGARP